MNHIKIIGTTLILTWCHISGMAQSTADSVKIIYRNNQAVVKFDGTTSQSTVKFEDGNDIVKVRVEHVSADADTSETRKKFDFSRGTFINIPKTPAKHHAVETGFLPEFDLGFASLPGNGALPATYQNMEMNMGKSANISLTLLSADVNLYDHKLSFRTGLGWNSYYFKPTNKSTLYALDQNGQLTAKADSNQYRKNRLDLSYVKIPLLLCYESNPDHDGKSFRIAAGVEYNFSGNTDIVRKSGNSSEHSEYVKNDADLKVNPTAWNAVVKIGYGPVTIFGRYGLTDTFKSSAFSGNSDLHLHPISFGIAILGV